MRLSFSRALSSAKRLRRMVVTLTVAIVSLASPILTTAAEADVAGSMNDYYRSMGAVGNVTGPSAFQGQSAGYYSLGNVYTRFPQKQIQLANLQLPGYRAGCGGIDIFAGSFSFINSAELIAMMKAVANNALGFAFKLAIDTLCPECGATMAELGQKVQQMNNQVLSSCQLAAGLVGGAWPKSDQADQAICEAIGGAKGIFSDAAASKHGCGSAGQRVDTLEGAATDPDFKDVDTGVARNFTWTVLKKSPFFNPGGVFDKQLAEYAMTLVGTLIYVPAGKDKAGTYNLVPGDATVAKVILEGTPAGSDAEIQTCPDDDCLSPVAQHANVPPAQAIKPRVNALILGMVSAINADTALTEDQKQLLQIASLPLYKILAVQTAYSHGLSVANVDTLTEVTAVDLMFSMMKQIMEEVAKSKASFVAADADKLTAWGQTLDQSRIKLVEQQTATQQRVQVVMQIVQQTAFIENVLQSQMSPQMSASLDFARGVSKGALN